MKPTYERIMVTLDGSQFAAAALPHAARMAEAFGSQLTLFRVVNESRVALPNESGYPGMLVHEINEPSVRPNYEGAQSVSQQIDHAEQALKHLSADLQRRGLEVTCAVDTGSPAKCIIEYAKQQEIDLVVMSTHGRAGLMKAVFGSVAQEVAHKADCPVLLVRPGE